MSTTTTAAATTAATTSATTAETASAAATNTAAETQAQAAKPKARRISTPRRQAILREWLLEGRSLQAIIKNATRKFGVRPERLQRDLDSIQAHWKDQCPGETTLNYLWFTRLQRDRLIGKLYSALRRCETVQQEMQIMRAIERVTSERDAVMDKIRALEAGAAPTMGRSLSAHGQGRPAGKAPTGKAPTGKAPTGKAPTGKAPEAEIEAGAEEERQFTLHEALAMLPPDVRARACSKEILAEFEAEERRSGSASANKRSGEPGRVSAPSVGEPGRIRVRRPAPASASAPNPYMSSIAQHERRLAAIIQELEAIEKETLNERASANKNSASDWPPRAESQALQQDTRQEGPWPAAK
jgi:hypothetical protein